MLEGSSGSPIDENESSSVLPGSKRTIDESAGSSKKTDAAQRAKRVRVSRACDQCRAGREKCNGGQPACQTCESQHRACSYNEQPKKRGIQPNYIRTLELTLAWLLQTYPESELKLAQMLPNADDPIHQVISCKDAASADALHSGWRSGIICRQIDQMLSGADIEIPRIPPSTIPQGVNSNAPYQSPPQSAPSDTGMMHDTSMLQLEIPEAVQTGIVGLANQDPDLLKLPQDSWALLEHYFAFTQAWLPITEKHDVLKLMYNYPANGLPRTEAVASEHAELWSIMAFSAARVDTSESRASFVLCRDVAKALIPSEHGFELGHIKALLILGLIEIAREAWITAWLTVGSAIRFLTHLTAGRGTATRLNEGRTKHTFLAAFLCESAIASRTGGLVHLRPDDVRSIGLLIEDGLEEWSPWSDPTAGMASAPEKSPARSISTFNELIRVALRCHTQQDTISANSSRAEMDLVFALLRNSSTHPRTLLTSFRSAPIAAPTSMSYMGEANTPQSGVGGHIRTNSNMGMTDAIFDQTYPFMSIPNDAAESLHSSTPAQAVGATPNLWGNGEGSSLDHANSLPVNDIFEELAMLDRAESNQNPSFMQNLGFGSNAFGADIELADFFGADYQWPHNYDKGKGPV